MAIKSSGALSLGDIQAEFGGPTPLSLGMYYAGGSYVPAGTAGIPSSGLISIGNFYGASNYTKTLHEYLTVGTYGYAVPTGATSLSVVVIGGGAHGGSARQTNFGEGTEGGGGGSGAVVQTTYYVSAGQSLSIQVGGGSVYSTDTPGTSSAISGGTSGALTAQPGQPGQTGVSDGYSITYGKGGTSGSGYLGGDGDGYGAGGGGGGAGGAGGPGSAGPGVSVTLNGTSYGILGYGGSPASYGSGNYGITQPANSGNGGGSAGTSGAAKQLIHGQTGASGQVRFWG